MATLNDVIRTRASVTRRLGTMDKNWRRYNRRYSRSVDSPLHACGDAFESNLQHIADEYQEILERINNATVDL